MINKQGLIFLTLTSLILVLSVYYVTMPTELLLTNNSLYTKTEDIEEVSKENTIVENTSTIKAMKSIHNDERMEKMKELNNKLTNKELSFEEKNNLYEEIKVINRLETIEEDIENMIKNEYNLDNFVNISDDVVEITVNSKTHNNNLAARILSTVEKKYDGMYMSVSFKE